MSVGKAPLSRRAAVLHVPLGLAGLLGIDPSISPAAAALVEPVPDDHPTDPFGDFPRTDKQRIYETVLYAHSDLDKVRGLLAATPTLANAAIDWGFGDWESAIGAASHMGRRDIAELLLGKGARPDLFTQAMMGHLDAVQAIVKAMPGIQRQRGPHGITLLAHARSGGERAARVGSFLEKLGDADPAYDNEPGMLTIDSYVGSFRYGEGENDVFEVVDRRGQLAVSTRDSFPFTLYHIGNHVFHPNGAPSMRFSFKVHRGRVDELSVADASMRIDARKVETRDVEDAPQGR